MIRKIIIISILTIFSSHQSYAANNSYFYDASNIIEQVSNYSLNDVLERCQTDFNYTQDDMELLEQELKRYLILCMLYKDISMYSKDVDNLWHSFILSTKQYAHFCDSIAGHFIHHVPATIKEKQDTSAEKKKANAQAFRRFVELYELTFHESIHDIWYLDGAEASAE